MKAKVWVAPIALGALLLSGGALAFNLARPHPVTRVVTVPVTVADIETSVMATGAVQPNEVVSISPQISGQLIQLDVKLGDVVTRGQVLGKIDSRQLLSELSQAQNALARATTRRRDLQVQLNASLNEQTRQQALLAAGVAALQKVEQADTAVRNTRNNLNNSELQIQSSELDIDRATNELEKGNLRAPIDGVVAEVLLPEGSILNIYRQLPVILRLARMQTMTIRALVSEADVPKVSQGQTVYFTILGDARRRYEGRLQNVEFTPSTGMLSAKAGMGKDAIYYEAVFEVSNPDGRLLPGMTANVHVVLDGVKNASTIPVAALGGAIGKDRYVVRVQEASGQVSSREIVTGLSDRRNIQVRSGLKSGEKVVVSEETTTAAS